jgi:hypothetical protein
MPASIIGVERSKKMPELDIRPTRNTTGTGWAWVIGAVIVALIIWWVLAAAIGARQAALAPVPAPQQRVAGWRQNTAPLSTALLPLAAIRLHPDRYFGQSVAGVGTVTDVLAKRAFRIDQGGQSALVVTDDSLANMPALHVGETVRLRGVVRSPQKVEQAPGMTLENPATLKLLQSEPAFIEASEIASNSAANPAANGGPASRP